MSKSKPIHPPGSCGGKYRDTGCRCVIAEIFLSEPVDGALVVSQDENISRLDVEDLEMLSNLANEVNERVGSEWQVKFSDDPKNALTVTHVREPGMFVRVRKVDNPIMVRVLGGSWSIASKTQWEDLVFAQATDKLTEDMVMYHVTETHLSGGTGL